jgi:molybdate transport system permease protein
MSDPKDGQDSVEPSAFKPGSDTPFLVGLGILGGSYAIIILAMIAADLAYVDPDSMLGALRSPEIHYSIVLSLLSCTLSTILSLWVAIPLGYLTSRFDFPGKRFLDTVLDIPIVLPPLVIGISLLALFNFAPFSWTSQWVVFEIPAVILAQFMVACAFATRAMRISFDQIPERYEKVALTLGCNRAKAFWLVVMPQAKLGIVAAGTLAWARALGEFGPILVFAGSTRMRTEVLPTSVYLEIQAGNLKGALAVSLIMIVAAAAVLATSRLMGMKRMVP